MLHYNDEKDDGDHGDYDIMVATLIVLMMVITMIVTHSTSPEKRVYTPTKASPELSSCDINTLEAVRLMFVRCCEPHKGRHLQTVNVLQARDFVSLASHLSHLNVTVYSL